MSWGPFTKTDWNCDGKIDHLDDAFEFGMFMNMMDGIERDERMDTIVQAIVNSGLSHVGNEEFEELCSQTGLRMSDFTQSDIDEIQRRLDRY